MKQQLIFKKTMTVYVEQRLTFEEFMKTNLTAETDEKTLIEVWKLMCDKSGNHGHIYVEDGERDDELDDYNCEDEIEEMVEELMEEAKMERERKMGATVECDTCDTKLIINAEDKDLKNLCDTCWNHKY